MSVSISHLLAAVLHLAACHRGSQGLEQCPFETARLKSASIMQLHVALANPDGSAVKKLHLS